MGRRVANIPDQRAEADEIIYQEKGGKEPVLKKISVWSGGKSLKEHECKGLDCPGEVAEETATNAGFVGCRFFRQGRRRGE